MTIASFLRRAAELGAACAILLGLTVVPAAFAGETTSSLTPARVLSDTWRFELGGLWANFDSGLQVSSGNLIGTSMNLENDLGLSSDTTTWNLNGYWRFGSANSVGFGYTSFSRTGSNKLKEAITVGDTVYDVDARLDSELDLQVLELYYRRSVVNNGKTEAGFTFGLSSYKIKASLAGEGTVNEDGESQYRENATESEDAVAPIPVVGLFVNYAFTPKLILMTNAEFFRLNVGDVGGRFISSRALLEYYFTKNVAAGVSIFGNYLSVEVDDRHVWKVNANQSGFGAHVAVVF